MTLDQVLDPQRVGVEFEDGLFFEHLAAILLAERDDLADRSKREAVALCFGVDFLDVLRDRVLLIV